MGHRQNAETLLFGRYSGTSFRGISECFPCGIQERYLHGLGLNERQQKAVHHVKTTGKITNQELHELTDVIIRTMSRDLEDLVRKGVLVKMGKTGRSTQYVLACKLDTNRTNRT